MEIGAAGHRYRWNNAWAKLPAEVTLGGTHGCIVVDRQDRVYVNTEGAYAVLVFSRDGTLIDKWGHDYRKQCHGMCLTIDPNGAENIWLAHFGRHDVTRFSLDGQALQTITYPKECPAYTKADEFKPTAVAVAPNGDLYIADGYGKHWVHQFKADGTWIRSWNGSEGAGGKFDTAHGIGIDTRSQPVQVVVADRSHHRLQRFTLDGKYLGGVEGFRRPCKIVFQGDDLVVPDLDGRVTILDKNFEVVTQLGDNPNPKQRANYGLTPEFWQDGVFIAPHGAAWDSHGDLYVQDWNKLGRITKLLRVH